ncbi:hypothetical protein BDA99DRAFT_558313 [Phascolomyces articulosus]|uniref:Uncharacterized protein n=1 Tax=Phascolomyces articulosus TaxID=60185 RepID=A0AAD5KDR1_9FUNG|nr:hypothetical protein BDA99DRAFT_558313 [Phascolomyces articulosus]
MRLYASSSKLICYGEMNRIISYTDYVFFSLDLSQGWSSVTEMENGWERLDHDIGPNSFSEMVAIPNENLIFMDGGGGGLDNGVKTVRYKSAIINVGSPNDGWSEISPE